MSERQVVKFAFEQSLSWEQDGGRRWSERVQARVTILDEALTSGWLRENFAGRRGGTNDFLLLVALVMHARPSWSRT